MTPNYHIGWMSLLYAVCQYTSFGFLLLCDMCPGASHAAAVCVSQRRSPSCPGSHLAMQLWKSAALTCVFSSTAVLKLCADEEDVHSRTCSCLSFGGSHCDSGSFLIRCLRKKKNSLSILLIFKGSVFFLTLSESLQIDKMAAVGYRGHEVNSAPTPCFWMSCSSVRRARQSP